MFREYSKWYSKVSAISKDAINKIDTMVIPFNSGIIFDIDNTLIHTSNALIGPVYSILQHARNRGLMIVIITNRMNTEEIGPYTESQLKAYNIDYNLLYLRNSPNISAWQYKQKAREDVYNRKINIIMSVGDQPWDFGTYGGIGIKIPTLTV